MPTSNDVSRDNFGHPLVQSILRASAVNANFELPVCGSGEGWIEARPLFEGDNERLRAMVMDYGLETWRTSNNHAACSVFISAYAGRVIRPAIAQYVLEHRVPKVTLDNLAFHIQEGRISGTALIHPGFAMLPGDPGVGHHDAELVADDAALYARLKEWLFEHNFTPVIAALSRAAGASVKVSQNAVASACAQAFRQLYPVVPDQHLLVDTATAFFDDPSSLVYRQVTMEIFEHQGHQGFFSRRAGCCLWWRTNSPKRYCSNCILLTTEEQHNRCRDMLARES
jgi:ferric iron reductase protein FhuF